MNFIGYDFYKGIDGFSSVSCGTNVSGISITNGIYDDFYLTKDPDKYKSDDLTWNEDTLIHVTFDQSSSGGNLPYILDNIGSFRLKRREVGAFEWTGLYEYTITDINNINFTYIDKFAKGRNTEYEYCIVPVSKEGVEQSYNTIKVVSNFDGAVIADKDTMYHILLEPSVTSTTRNKDATVISTMNNKYPFVFYGSNANYHSGSFSGVVIKYNGNDSWDFDKSVEYRDEMTEWLTNGEPKILKMWDGRIWMINVSGNITSDSSEHPDKVTISFDFVEIGDTSSTEDLYNNGFVNYTTKELGV